MCCPSQPSEILEDLATSSVVNVAQYLCEPFDRCFACRQCTFLFYVTASLRLHCACTDIKNRMDIRVCDKVLSYLMMSR